MPLGVCSGAARGPVQCLTLLGAQWALRFLPGQIPRVFSCSVRGAVPSLMDVRPPGGPHIGHPELMSVSVPFLAGERPW